MVPTNLYVAMTKNGNDLSLVNMKTVVIAAILTLGVGCGELERTGGGSRGVDAGGITKEVVYGIRAGKKLGFAMFTDIPSEGTIVSAGSKWSGHIKPAEGLAVDYRAVAGGLEIHGTKYEFAEGRVFLVSTTEARISVDQLNVVIGEATFEAELDRVSKVEAVQGFLAQ